MRCRIDLHPSAREFHPTALINAQQRAEDDSCPSLLPWKRRAGERERVLGHARLARRIGADERKRQVHASALQWVAVNRKPRTVARRPVRDVAAENERRALVVRASRRVVRRAESVEAIAEVEAIGHVGRDLSIASRVVRTGRERARLRLSPRNPLERPSLVSRAPKQATASIRDGDIPAPVRVNTEERLRVSTGLNADDRRSTERRRGADGRTLLLVRRTRADEHRERGRCQHESADQGRSTGICATHVATVRPAGRPVKAPAWLPVVVALEPKGDMHLCKGRTFEASRVV